MALYYVSANTYVKGEVIINDNSFTYTATASALDSSNVSFKDAANIAIIHSNSAATIAARSDVDKILAQHSYVLSETTITSMINNSLKTTIRLIKPVLLETIASTVDGKNYVLNKNTIIKKYQLLFIPNGKRLVVDLSKFTFTNFGIIQVGNASAVSVGNKACTGCSSPLKDLPTSTCTGSSDPCCLEGQCTGGSFSIVSAVNFTFYVVPGLYNITSGSCMEINTVKFTLESGATINNSGCISLIGGSSILFSSGTSSTSTYVKNLGILYVQNLS